MYFILTPKIKIKLDFSLKKTLYAQIFKGDKKYSAKWFKKDPIIDIKTQMPDGSMSSQYGGSLQPLLKLTKKEITIHSIEWTIEAEFPEYLNREELFSDILQKVYEVIGDYEIYCIPIDKTFFAKDAESITSIGSALSDMYPNMRDNQEMILPQIINNSEIRNVVKTLLTQPTPYAIILTKIYAVTLTKHDLQASDMAYLIENVFSKLENKKWARYRSYLLFKFFHGARYFRSRLLRIVSTKDLSHKYAALLDKCSINLETTQFLLHDLVFLGINKSQNATYKELKEHFIKRILKYKGVIINFPEIYSYYIESKTGNLKEAFFAYKMGVRNKTPATKLHRVYDKLIPGTGFITQFKNQKLPKYFKKLNFIEKLKNSSVYSPKGTLGPRFTLAVLIAVVLHILVSTIIYVYLQNIALGNNFLELVHVPLTNVFVLMFFSGFISILPIFVLSWITIELISYFNKDNHKKNTASTIISLLGIPFNISIIAVIFLFIANLFIGMSFFLGVTETKIISGLNQHEFSNFEAITILGKACPNTDRSCRGQYDLEIRLHKKGKETSTNLVLDGPDDLFEKGKISANCNIVSTIISSADDNKVSVIYGPLYKKVMDLYCSGKQALPVYQPYPVYNPKYITPSELPTLLPTLTQ